jgi:hypothetical protein
MSIFTMRELEFVASLKQRWTNLYFNELTRLLRELDEPYLLRPRAPLRRRPSGPSAMNQRPGRKH